MVRRGMAWRGAVSHSLDDQSALRFALDIELVTLAQELDVLLEELERNPLFGSVHEHRSDLFRGSAILPEPRTLAEQP